jgi:chloramphenicol O-acetyltransferase
MNTYPTNQFILNGESMFNHMNMDAYLNNAEAYLQRMRMQNSHKLIWDEIDAEVNPMTDEQKNRLLLDEEYASTYTELQNLVQSELLNLVKARIESTDKGKDLLSKQLRIIRNIKGKIINDTNREMELFMRFKEFSKQNPNITYEEFIKASI